MVCNIYLLLVKVFSSGRFLLKLLIQTDREEQRSNLVDDAKSSWASTPIQPISPHRRLNIEVVIKHARQTTTSKAETRLGVITVSKPKLTTHENSDRSQTVCASRVQPATVQAHSILLVDVTGISRMTMSTQLQPNRR